MTANAIDPPPRHRRLHACCGSLVLAALGCGPTPRDEPGAPAPGDDCLALLAAGERARGCDPAIDRLLHALRDAPDERRCRTAARQLLAPPRSTQGRVVSVHERPPALADAPLDAAERDALAALPLPGRLVLAPDLAPKPGLPATTATLAGAALQLGADGRLRGHGPPGPHTLAVRHANEQTLGCVTLTACETVSLTAHGASLAPHPALKTAPCEPPGPAER